METAITTVTAGAFIAAIGLLIRYKGATSLIAGFDSDKISDEEGLSRFIGLNTLYIASLTIIAGLIEFSELNSGLYWKIYTVMVIVIASRMMLDARNYN